MISLIQPPMIGNALQLYLSPPRGAEYWRVLRKPTNDISGPEDSSAFIAYEGDDIGFIDSAYLVNETMYFYIPYYRIAGAWVPGAGNYGTPASTYEDYSTDVISLVRERLESGLKVEVERGTLINDLGYIQVMTAPPSQKTNLSFPLVTVALEDESSSERGIGEDIDGGWEDEESHEWLEENGWLASVSLSIGGYSLNPTERRDLRAAIRRVIVANLNVFADKGIVLPHLSLTDTDAVNGELGPTPLYLVVGKFTCTAPIRVGRMADGVITDINVEATNNG
jgi:hypothetical protein